MNFSMRSSTTSSCLDPEKISKTPCSSSSSIWVSFGSNSISKLKSDVNVLWVSWLELLRDSTLSFEPFFWLRRSNIICSKTAETSSSSVLIDSFAWILDSKLALIFSATFWSGSFERNSVSSGWFREVVRVFFGRSSLNVYNFFLLHNHHF